MIVYILEHLNILTDEWIETNLKLFSIDVEPDQIMNNHSCFVTLESGLVALSCARNKHLNIHFRLIHQIEEEPMEKDKVEKEEDEFWVVVNDNFLTNIDCKHSSFVPAKNEAIRLAKLYNKKFLVLRSIYAVEVNSLIETQYTSDIPF